MEHYTFTCPYCEQVFKTTQVLSSLLTDDEEELQLLSIDELEAWFELVNSHLKECSDEIIKKHREQDKFNELLCTCGNPENGFDCVCEWVRMNPGNICYTCEYCGLYTASAPRCNKCKEVTE